MGDPKVKWVTHFVGKLDKKSYFTQPHFYYLRP